MVRLEADPFLNDLVKKFERRKEKGSVTITLKRSCLANPRSKKAKEALAHKCLIRASDGKKNISVAVSAKDQARFHASFSTILKAHMDTLKKRARTDKAKAPKK